jgi:hypothetical protein
MWGKTFADRIIALLVHWNSARIEREALAYALRWDGSSKLAVQVDKAFLYCLAWMQEVGDLYRDVASRNMLLPTEAAPYQALELVRQNLAQLLVELRSRSEFLSARAANIRISGDLHAVAGALLSLESEKLATAIAAALIAEASTPGNAELARIANEHPELEKAPAGDLERFGRKVEEKARARGFDVRGWIAKNGGQLALGVGSNVLYASLKAMFPGVVPQALTTAAAGPASDGPARAPGDYVRRREPRSRKRSTGIETRNVGRCSLHDASESADVGRNRAIKAALRAFS